MFDAVMCILLLMLGIAAYVVIHWCSQEIDR